MIVRGCGVLVVAAVTGKACRPPPKSPWSGVGREVFYVGSPVEFVPIVFNGFIWLLSEIVILDIFIQSELVLDDLLLLVLESC